MPFYQHLGFQIVSDSIEPESGLRLWTLCREPQEVQNVGAHNPEGGDGGVEFHLHVDWNAPLDVIVTISVLEDIEGFVEG